MPKQKQFIVYNDDIVMFIYIPEDDDHAIATKRAGVYSFKEAKNLIINNLRTKFERDLADIESLTYKDFQ